MIHQDVLEVVLAEEILDEADRERQLRRRALGLVRQRLRKKRRVRDGAQTRRLRRALPTGSPPPQPIGAATSGTGGGVAGAPLALAEAPVPTPPAAEQQAAVAARLRNEEADTAEVRPLLATFNADASS